MDDGVLTGAWRFHESICKTFMMELRWPHGVVKSPHCGSEHVTYLEKARVRRGFDPIGPAHPPKLPQINWALWPLRPVRYDALTLRRVGGAATFMNTPGDARPESEANKSRSLGEIKVEAFDQDVAINDRHQSFSAELLRLALLGVGGVGYVASRSLSSPQAGQPALSVSDGAKWLVLIAALSFGLAAAFALALRYISSDLLTFQLRILRLRIRGNPTDVIDADKEELRRNWRLKATRPMLVLSSVFLGVGAGVFIAFLFSVLGP